MNLSAAFVNILFLFFIAWKIWKQAPCSLKKFFWPACLAKLVAGLSLGLLYKYYYSAGDTFGFFDNAVTLARLAYNDVPAYLQFLWNSHEQSPVWNELAVTDSRSVFFSKFVSVASMITGGNYWVASLYFSFISFLGAWQAVKSIVRWNPDAQRAAVVAFLFFPSIVFWSSGIIKESLAMAALFFIVSLFVKIWMRRWVRALEWLLAIVSAWVLWNLKYYYAAVLFPVLLTTLMVRFVLIPIIKVERFALSLFLWLAVFIVPLLLVTLIHPNFYLHRFLAVIVENHNEFIRISDPDSVIHFYHLEPSPISMILNTPWALFSCLFRPLVFEVSTLFQFLISIENLLMLAILTGAVVKREFTFRLPNGLLTIAVTSYIIMLAAFLALSTPNFGTLVRYRVGFLPFFVFLITYQNPVIGKIFNRFQRSFRHLVR